MENFVTTVRSQSGAGNFLELVDFLQKSSDSLSRNSSSVLSNVLETLDINQHSLGVLAVLRARLVQNPIGDWDDLFNRIAVFVLECNGEQVRYWAKCFAELCHLFTERLVRRNTPIVGIPPLLKAISKIQLSETSLTSVHGDVCRLCLAAKCFSPAVSNLLEIDYIDIAQEASEEPKNILLFFYYGGMIFTALKMFERALYYFEVCVTVPTTAVSHIMMEAYKKYLLVSLIVHGDRPKDACSLPKYTSPIISKYIKPLCAPYQELVSAYNTSMSSELENVMNQYLEVFETDLNSGLVRQVAVAQTKSNIKRLTKTFVTLSLSDVASRIGLSSPQEAEKKIVAMIEEGSIHARISQKDGMVQFDANPESFNSVRMLTELENRVSTCISINSQISQMEEDIILSTSYIKKSILPTGPSGPVASTPGTGASRSADLDGDLFGQFGGAGSGLPSRGSISANAVSTIPSSSSGTQASNHVNANHVNSAGNSSNMNGPSALH